jgi:two-component system, chemotaxis family, chemotaxis protein CheY
MRVLIVDDEALVRTITDIFLKDVGVDETIHATNGREALAFLKSESTDLIISDRSMPEMDGLELVRACKADPALKDIPFVMSSGQGDRAEILKAVEAGVDAYIVKPFLLNELQDILEKIGLQVDRKSALVAV